MHCTDFGSVFQSKSKVILSIWKFQTLVAFGVLVKAIAVVKAVNLNAYVNRLDKTCKANQERKYEQ